MTISRAQFRSAFTCSIQLFNKLYMNNDFQKCRFDKKVLRVYTWRQQKSKLYTKSIEKSMAERS